MTSFVSTINTFVLASLIIVYSGKCTPVKKVHAKGGDVVFDWRQKGVISPVTDQGQLGAAIAFVIAEGVESLLAIQTGKPVTILSRREVADCCVDDLQPKYPGYDCIVLIGGLCTEAAYNSPAGTCNNGTCPAIGKVTKSGYIQSNREDLMVEVIHQTPLSALMDASQISFQTYVSGIYSDPNCSSTELDHVVQIVGYGTTTSGENYWIIRNSWGANWGEQGYMKIARGKNMCGIASSVFYPIN